MFERDPFGLNPSLGAAPNPGGNGTGRHALRRRDYLAARRVRLAAEADERRLQEAEAQAVRAATLVGRARMVLRAVLSGLAPRRRGGIG